MKALTFIDQELKVSELERPERAGEALIRILRSGICNTDLEIVRGYAGFSGTLGHEFVGVVEASVNAPELVGKRVVGEINVGCGDCERCRELHDSRHCPTRTVLGIKGRDGCHADFVRLPQRNLLMVPDNVADDEAVFAEPLAAAFAIIEQVEVSSETKIAVIGDGKLGILSALCLRTVSNHVCMIGKHSSKLAIAERSDVETILVEKLPDTMKSHFDVVVEASGSESGFSTALDIIRPRGKLVLKSTFHGSTSVAAWRVVVDEISVIGSRCGKMASALELLKNGVIDVRRLISDEFPLAEGPEAMSAAARKGVLKVLLAP
ncbi:MAG: alcohol dehydrogenase catalytic domain-containing protein [Pyrinomonadaceae bacterium]